MDGVEEAELTQPAGPLTAAGADVDIISRNTGTVQSFRHHTPSIKISIDKTFARVSPGEYAALLLPGGAPNAHALRVVPAAQALAAAFDNADKPIAAICHAPWLLVFGRPSRRPYPHECSHHSRRHRLRRRELG